MPDPLDRTETPKEKLIREIRDDYSYFKEYWRENYEEAKVDLRYVSGDPWEADERQKREDNGRPVLSPDELDQYLNATINNLRQNPLGIKVEPKGSGATDEDAERRQAIIRNIEYDSIAQAAYTNAFSCAINCGFGFFRVTTKKVSKDNEVEPRIKIIGNPMSVMLDPNAKEADYSDQKRCFVIDVLRTSDFVRAYPTAEKKSFSVEDMQAAPDWFESAENIVVAEYWRIDGYDEDGQGGKVTQYITNGLEILETREWAGSRIPIIPVLGKETYVPRGGKMARMFYSMIRKARGPQMMLAYIASQEAEEFGMSPRAPFVMYQGQVSDANTDAWTNVNKIPRGWLDVQMPDWWEPQWGPPPLPQRPQFTPNAQAYEVSREAWRRQVQSAMGITPLPTAAQRQNEKSGVALQRIENQQAIGSYHFTANFKLSLQNAGTQLNELITEVIDTPRQIAGRGQDDEQKLIHVVPGGQQPPEGVNPEDTFNPSAGEFDVTISSGPSYQSQREAASDFVDQIVQQIDALPIAPQAKASILALGVKLKDIGPLGDQMAKILDPQNGEPVPPQAQQMIAQLQQQLQVAHDMGAKLFQKVQELEFDKKAQITKGQTDIQLKQMDIEARVAVAQIETKAQDISQRLDVVSDLMQQFLQMRHESVMQDQQAQNAQQLASQQAQAASQQSSQDAAEASSQSMQDAGQQSAQSAQEAAQQPAQ